MQATTKLRPRDVSVWNQKIFPALRAALRLGYFSLEVEGAEHVPPDGPIVYAGNHSGWFALDALVFALAVHDHIAPERMPYAIVQDLLLTVPGLRSFFGPLGVVPVSQMRNLGELPPEIDAFGVFPEGVDAICKPVWEAYRMRPWRPGFVHLALARGARIVPVALIGGEECLPSLDGIDLFKPWLGVSVPIPLSPLPLPTRWKMVFGPVLALDPQASVADPAYVHATCEQVRSSVQSMLDVHTEQRPIRRLRA